MANPKRWGFDVRVSRYRDLDSGRFLPKKAMITMRDRVLDTASKEARTLAEQAAKGTISPETFRAGMRELLRNVHGSEAIFGRGGVNAMTPADWGRLGQTLKGEYAYLEGFVTDIATLTPEQAAARAQLYMGAAVQSYEKGVAASLGIEDSMPVYPGDGSTRCVASPSSRVSTMRGLVAISDVVVGDLVLTHRGRFRPVTAIIRSASQSRPFLEIAVNQYAPVKFTADHRLYSERGWYPVDGIMHDNMQLLVNRGGYDENGNMHGLRESLRSSGATLPIVLKSSQGTVAMERSGDAPKDDHLSSGEGGGAQIQVRGHYLGFELANSRRWASVPMVLGRGPASYDLSLSMGMDQSEWTDSATASHSSQVGEQGRRCLGESLLFSSSGALRATHDADPSALDDRQSRRHANREPDCDLRTVWASVQDSQPRQAESVLLTSMSDRVDANNACLSDMRGDVYRWVGSWETPEVLQSGVLPDETILYDLTVDEDHSFVIEGIVAHNCLGNCRCTWVHVRNGDNMESTWQTEQDGQVCQDCAANGRKYAPLITPMVDKTVDTTPVTLALSDRRTAA